MNHVVPLVDRSVRRDGDCRLCHDAAPLEHRRTLGTLRDRREEG